MTQAGTGSFVTCLLFINGNYGPPSGALPGVSFWDLFEWYKVVSGLQLPGSNCTHRLVYKTEHKTVGLDGVLNNRYSY